MATCHTNAKPKGLEFIPPQQDVLPRPGPNPAHTVSFRRLGQPLRDRQREGTYAYGPESTARRPAADTWNASAVTQSHSYAKPSSSDRYIEFIPGLFCLVRIESGNIAAKKAPHFRCRHYEGSIERASLGLSNIYNLTPRREGRIRASRISQDGWTESGDVIRQVFIRDRKNTAMVAMVRFSVLREGPSRRVPAGGLENQV